MQIYTFEQRSCVFISTFNSLKGQSERVWLSCLWVRDQAAEPADGSGGSTADLAGTSAAVAAGGRSHNTDCNNHSPAAGAGGASMPAAAAVAAAVGGGGWSSGHSGHRHRFDYSRRPSPAWRPGHRQ